MGNFTIFCYIWSEHLMFQVYNFLSHMAQVYYVPRRVHPTRAVYKTLGLVRLRLSPLHRCPPEEGKNLCHSDAPIHFHPGCNANSFSLSPKCHFIFTHSCPVWPTWSFYTVHICLAVLQQNCLDGRYSLQTAKVLHNFWPRVYKIVHCVECFKVLLSDWIMPSVMDVAQCTMQLSPCKSGN